MDTTAVMMVVIAILGILNSVMTGFSLFICKDLADRLFRLESKVMEEVDRERRRKPIAATLCCALIVSMSGCGAKREIVNVPQGVSPSQVNAWYDAAQATRAISEVTRVAAEGVVRLNRQGVFPDGYEYRATVTVIKGIADTGSEAVAFLQSVPDTWTEDVQVRMVVYVNQMFALADRANNAGILHIKNAEARRTFSAIIETLRTAIQAVNAVITIARAKMESPPLWRIYAVENC